MLVLTGTNNNYTGGTLVSAGTLNVANAGAIPVGDNVTVGAGGTWIFGSLVAGGPISGLISGTMVSSTVSSGAAVPAGVDPVPEPGTLALLLAAGLSALFAYRRRKR
jgi:autotransporter-associated beta strand protein